MAPTGADGEVLVTGGDGVIRRVDARTGTVIAEAAASGDVMWDNHLGRLVRT